jgi:hypothetical protein
VSPDAVHSHSSTSAAVVPHPGMPSPPGAAAGGGRGVYSGPLPRYGSGTLPSGPPYGMSPYSTPPGAAGRPIVGPVGGRPPPFVPRTGPMGLLDRYGGGPGGGDLHSPPSISTQGLPYDAQHMAAAGGRYSAASYYDHIRGGGTPAAGRGRPGAGWGPPADPYQDHPHHHHPHQQQQYGGGYHPRETGPPAGRHGWHPHQQQEGGWYEEPPMPYRPLPGVAPRSDPMFDRAAAGFDQGWGPGGHSHPAAAGGGPPGGSSRGYEPGGYDRMYPPSGSSRGQGGYGEGPSGPGSSSMGPLGPSPSFAVAGGRPGGPGPSPHAAAGGGGGSSGRYMLTGDPALDGSLPSCDALELQLIAAGAQELLEDLSPRHGQQQHLQQQGLGGSRLSAGGAAAQDPLLLSPGGSRPGPPMESPAAKRQRLGLELDASLLEGAGPPVASTHSQQQQQQGGTLSPHGPSHASSMPPGGSAVVVCWAYTSALVASHPPAFIEQPPTRVTCVWLCLGYQ